jgi:hypothetical protein
MEVRYNMLGNAVTIASKQCAACKKLTRHALKWLGNNSTFLSTIDGIRKFSYITAEAECHECRFAEVKHFLVKGGAKLKTLNVTAKGPEKQILEVYYAYALNT